MTRFAVFYMFSEVTSSLALKRLKRLRIINPDVTFVPVVGIRQFLNLPLIVDENMPGTMRRWRLIGPVAHLANSIALSRPGVFRLSHAINQKIGALASRGKITELRSDLYHDNLKTFYPDFTPTILYNGDHAITNWYNSSGKLLDFDHLIFYEYDIYTTKPLDSIYRTYAKSYDACFNEYSVATPDWFFYNFPPGCNGSTRRWLKQRNLPTTLYRSLFGGCMISRSALERLKDLKIDFSGTPYCFAEMRLPTILSALGFKCGQLNFPCYRYRPTWSEEEIRQNANAGIFHPVKSLTSDEAKC